MPFSDHSNTPASNTEIDGIFIGPNMARNDVRRALQQIVAYGRDLSDTVIAGGGDLPAFIGVGTGAVQRTALAKMRDTVAVKDFGATGDGATSDTAAINLALDGSASFTAGTYKAGALVSSAGDHFGGLGAQARIEKNANGALWTHAGTYGSFRDLTLDGTGFTGAGLVLSSATGQTDLHNVNVQAAEGIALDAAGPVRVFGGVFYTTNADTGVADIKIGTSGTASLYSVLCGARTSQATHGLYEIDTGNTARLGIEIGNMTIAKSVTAPAGINGGQTVGSRIGGNVTMEQSNATFVGNILNGDFIVGAGTTYVTLGPDNIVRPDKKVDQLGSVSRNYVCVNRADGTNALGGIRLCYGGSGPGGLGAGAEWWIAQSADGGNAPDVANARIGTPGKMFAKSFALLDTAGTGTFDIIANPSGSNVNVGNAAGFTQILANSTGAIFTIAGASISMTVKGDGLYAGANKVVGARGAAVADATDAASAITQLNALLARMRAHGLIAT